MKSNVLIGFSKKGRPFCTAIFLAFCLLFSIQSGRSFAAQHESDTVTLGFVGCSVTNNAIAGYELVGGSLFWPPVSDYGGGGISAWALDLSDMSRYWSAFEQAVADHPQTDTLWLQLCTAERTASQDTFANTRVIIDEIHRRLPDVTLFISAQPGYSDGVCRITGEDGPARMQDIVNQVVAGQLAKAGPVVGPLRRNQTSDGCHANNEGQRLLGRQLARFFGK